MVELNVVDRCRVAGRRALLAGALAAIAGPTEAAASEPTQVVERLEFTVQPALLQKYRIVGYFSAQLGGDCSDDLDRTLQVVIHGGTYNHAYWDAGTVNGVDYSYAHYMTARCYAVLALDMLATGESSRPPGDLLSVPGDSAALKQILGRMRGGNNPLGQAFDRIVLVGHSFGSITSVYTLGTYQGVADALVTTGWGHAQRNLPITEPELLLELATSDHLVLSPALRTKLFYHPPTSDPAVVEYDNEVLADSLPRGRFVSVAPLFTAIIAGEQLLTRTLSRVSAVDVPVLVQLGEYDIIAPATMASKEAAYYCSAPSVTVEVLPDMGHDVNLHLNHVDSWAGIDAWIDDTLGI
jgi:pimeloyl-ACP methyl ester carboxylesterase